MTAITAFPKGPKPCLITDTAAYLEDGTLTGFYSKVATLPHLRMALAVRGSYLLPGFFAAFLGSKFSSFDEVIQEGASYLEQVFYEIEPALAGNLGFEMTVLGWSEARDSAACYQLVNMVHPETPEQIEEWQFFEFEDGVAAPMPSVEALQAAGWQPNWDPRGFDPDKDTIWFMEAQRRTKGKMRGVANGGADAISPVGGEAVVTIVARDGISQKVVHRWHDEIGKPLKPDFKPVPPLGDPYPPASNVVPMSRQQRRAMERAARKRG